MLTRRQFAQAGLALVAVAFAPLSIGVIEPVEPWQQDAFVREYAAQMKTLLRQPRSRLRQTMLNADRDGRVIHFPFREEVH